MGFRRARLPDFMVYMDDLGNQRDRIVYKVRQCRRSAISGNSIVRVRRPKAAVHRRDQPLPDTHLDPRLILRNAVGAAQNVAEITREGYFAATNAQSGVAAHQRRSL